MFACEQYKLFYFTMKFLEARPRSLSKLFKMSFIVTGGKDTLLKSFWIHHIAHFPEAVTLFPWWQSIQHGLDWDVHIPVAFIQTFEIYLKRL